MCTSESKINKNFTITTKYPTASHRISHPSFTRVPSSPNKSHSIAHYVKYFYTVNYTPLIFTNNDKKRLAKTVNYDTTTSF